MKRKFSSPAILVAVFLYVLLQFTWWEILLVRQNDALTTERERLTALNAPDAASLDRSLALLRHRKNMQTLMIVGEGTIFLLLLLYGVSRIRRAQAAEERFGKNQKNFFLSVTHELKTPIAAVQLQLQTLAKQKLDEPARLSLVGRALEENERLNALIDKVLLASSLESGELMLKKEKTDLSEMVTAICSRYFGQAVDAGQLVVNAPSGVEAYVDQQLFPSVIINLIENALKYSGRPSQVVVRVEAAGRARMLSVADNGDGIDDAERDRIFERFYRSGNESVRRSKGTGLGLYIVKYIVVKHGGLVSVAANKPHGSVFQVRLDA